MRLQNLNPKIRKKKHFNRLKILFPQNFGLVTFETSSSAPSLKNFGGNYAVYRSIFFLVWDFFLDLFRALSKAGEKHKNWTKKY